MVDHRYTKSNLPREMLQPDHCDIPKPKRRFINAQSRLSIVRHSNNMCHRYQGDPTDCISSCKVKMSYLLFLCTSMQKENGERKENFNCRYCCLHSLWFET
ncbi:hypothetical protein EUGRSUZ_K00843 [Eucalyptus grandis]|uniref:Uncharacterized protein n=2 Tax=Eucalyptus grandis TaxID=71139 RepID=A0ACC3IRR8_EUCGR|nr:hypothetical protein EUGRSUZ_K00843 [Eucalyptus grandis]